jgi:hypothetical protein
LFYPQDNGEDVPAKPGLTLEPVSTVAQVTEKLIKLKVFNQGQVNNAIQRWRTQTDPGGHDDAGWFARENAPDSHEHWIFTCVGRRDPFGLVNDDREPDDRRTIEEEGPILAACRAIRPSHLFLFHTVFDDPVGGENNFTSRAMQVKDIVHKESDCGVNAIPLTTVTDPTDYAQLFPGMKSAVEKVLSEYNRTGRTIWVCPSSGTSQMEHVWHLLVDHKVIADARRIQVREGRFVSQDQHRVRLAEPPIAP